MGDGGKKHNVLLMKISEGILLYQTLIYPIIFVQVNCQKKETVEFSPEERFQMVESFSDLPMDL